jgi:hypothetical protein
VKRIMMSFLFGIAGLFSLESQAEDQWISRGEKFPSVFINAITAGPHQIIAVGDSGGYLTSADGKTWKQRMMESRSFSLGSILWAGTQFVATGKDYSGQGIALLSPDGISWTKSNIGTARKISHAIWTGTLIVAIDSAGMGFTSEDGRTWITTKVVEPWFKINGIVWTGSQIVAMGVHWQFNYVGIVSTSPDGKNWTSKPENRIGLHDIYTWTGKQIIALGSDSTFSSPDGLAWTTKVSDLGTYIRSIVSSGTQIVGLGELGNSFYSSKDGLKWTSRLMPSDPGDYYKCLTWTGSQFIAVSSLGAIRASPDGITWTLVEVPKIPPHLYSVVSSGSEYRAVGERGTLITSTDGITWSAGSTGTHHSLRCIIQAGSQFIAVGDSGVILSSPNGKTWTQRVSGTFSSLKSITWTASHFVAVGDAGTVLTSPDGITWTVRNSGTTFTLNSIAWSGNQLVAVSELGGMISSDGISWTASNITETRIQLKSIIWTGKQFVAAGNHGTILLSPDGITWTRGSTGEISRNLMIQSITWTGSKLVAVGSFQGRIYALTSINGRNWTRTRIPTERLSSITWTGNQLITVGNYMAIFSQSSIPTGIASQADFRESLSLRISPASLSVTLPNDMLVEKVKVRIYEFKGEKVLERTASPAMGELMVPISKLGTGRYLLEVTGLNHRLSKPFVLIQ